MSKYPGRLITDLADAGHSVFFDGSGDYLTVPSNAAFTLGTGVFTLEFWAYTTTFSNFRSYLSNRNGTETNRWGIDSNSSGQFYFYANNATVATSSGYGANQWLHICVTRASTSTNGVRIFVNGRLEATGTSATDFAADIVSIGASPTGSQPFVGYMSNVRIIKGAIPAEYSTNSTTVGAQIFTPPTQLFPITNTSLLTCQSPTIIDNSSNAFAITPNGNVVTSTLTPFTAYNPYNPALGASTPGVWTLDEAMQAQQTRQWNMYDPHFNRVSLLLRSGATDGAQNNTFQDSSSNNFTITRNGNTTQGAFTPFSQTGWSLRTDDRSYLTIPASSDFDLISTDFTVEFWVNVNAFNTMSFSGNNFFGNGLATAVNGWSMGFAGSGTTVTSIEYRTFTSSTQAANTFTGLALSFGVWYHVVLQRNGSGSNNLRLFVNGVQQGAAQTAVTYSSAGGTFSLGSGSYLQNATYSGNADYYISNLRVTKSAVYSTSGFNSPTEPLSQITNTTMLICQSGRLVNNGTNTGVITSSGFNATRAQVLAISPFYPQTTYTPQTVGGSGFFDGTADNLTIAGNSAFAFGTGDFTLEAWINPNSISTGTFDRVCATSDFNGSGFDWVMNTGGTSLFLAGASYGFSINTISWNHVVFTRSGSVLRGFLNGRLAVYSTPVGQNITSTTSLLVGQGYSGTNLNGYMTDLRIIKGSIPTAYQTSATTTGTQVFTAPTAPLTTTSQGATAGNVSLLLNFTNAAVTDATGKHVFETTGNAQASTARRNTQLVITPPTSVYFDGTGDSLFIPPAQKEYLRFGVHDFTIDFWAWKSANGASGYDTVISVGSDGNFNGGFSVELSNTRGFCFVYDAAVRISASMNPNDSTWHHYAVVRNGGTIALFRDGVLLTSAGLTPTLGVTGNAYIGSGASSTGSTFNGYIDDLRVTRGVARYTATFTPPRSRLQEQ
jgi:hypothetical protein